jgi:thymidylate kinase
MDKNEIFRLLLEYLDQAHIVYVLTESMNHNAGGDSVANIIVSTKDFKKINYHIKEFSKQFNIIPIQKLRYETSACLFVMCYYKQQTKKLIDFKVSFQSDYKIKGRLYLSDEELLSNRTYIIEEAKWQLNYTYSFLYHGIKSIDEKNISNKDFLQLLDCWTNDYKCIAESLKRFFTDEGIKIITDSFQGKGVAYLNTKMDYLQKDLHLKVRKRVQVVIQNKVIVLRGMLKPSGLVVGVLGRDGSGKSTFVGEMSNALGTYFKNTTTFKKCPAIFYKGAIFNKNEGYHFSKPHLYNQRNTFQSFLKLNLLLVEFMLGYWLKVFPAKAKSHLVMYDRYFTDVLADPLRYRIKDNRFFIKIIHYILPKPDLWIIIDLPSHILLQRKQELTYEMSEKLRYKYLELQHLLSNCIVINNEEEIDKTVNKATTFIFNYMQQKIAV